MSAMLVDDASFRSLVLTHTKPVLVDFFASWCQPCRSMSPIIDRLARARNGFRVVKVDVEAAPFAACQFKVRSVPTLVLFRGGLVVARRSGAVSTSEELQRWVQKKLGA